MELQNTLEARVVQPFNSSAEQVFDAWLDPQLVGRWMFGPAIRDEQVISIEIDPKPGGAFSFLVQRQSHFVDHVGTYIKIERPRHLEFNWGVKGMGDSSRVDVTIEPTDSGCKLTLVHELHPDWKDYLQRCIDGWSEMMGVLAKTLAASGKGSA